MTNACVCCTRPMSDVAYACPSCGGKAAAHLRDIIDMTGAARDVAHGQARRGSGGGGGSEPRLPLNLGATQRLDAVQRELVMLARMVAEERQGAIWVWTDDAIIEAAMWLTSQTEWLRHHQAADEHFAIIASCARVVEGVARGPSSQRYLGPCGAQLVDVMPVPDGEGSWDLVEVDIDTPCPGDIYAREGASDGRCRLCGATVGVGDRRAWLDAEVRSRAFRAVEIAQAYGINVNTIRSWAARGQLVAHGHDRDERPLYNVGDVLDLAAADAARRAGDQAKRARRKDNAA